MSSPTRTRSSRARGVRADEPDPAVPVSPPARRRRDTWWRDPRLAVGLLLVAASVMLGAALLGERTGAGVWATRVPLSEGQSVGPGDLVRAEVAFPDQQAADRYLSADASPPTGGVVSHDVAAGELLPRAALTTAGAGAAAAAASEAVEVPLAVLDTAVPRGLAPGSTVDVWVTPDPSLGGGLAGEPASEAELVLSGVRVSGIDAAGGFAAGGDRQVLVAVDPEQQSRLSTVLATLATGRAVLVLAP